MIIIRRIVLVFLGSSFCCLPFSGYAMDNSPFIRLILADKLHQNTEHFLIIDSRPKSQFQKAHIPGAKNLDWKQITVTDSNGIPYRLPALSSLAENLASLGIQNDSPVLVYGSGQKNWGAEGWAIWLLAYLGHTGDIFFLQGGWDEWMSKGYPVEQGVSMQNNRTHPYTYKVNSAFFADFGEISSEDAYLVDTRTFFERLNGSIPGAIHISWKHFFQTDGRTPLNNKDFAELMTQHQIKRDKPVIYFCTGGIRSAWAWLVHQRSGYSTARNFEGGMALWKKQP